MREKLKTVKNIAVHTAVLLLLFVAAVVCFERWINQTVPVTAEEMATSTFPLVYIRNRGVNYNCLHGYAGEMDVNYIRDTVTVLNDSHELDIQIQPFSTNIEDVSYEVLTLDGSQSLENTKVIRLEEENNYLNATLSIQYNLLLGQEYILKIQVEAGGRRIYYYTRLLLEDGLHLEAYLDFVTGFYEKCVNKTDEGTLAAVVEPDDTTDELDSLAHMDLHDSVNRLEWGDLNPQVYYKPTPSLVDINGTTASFVLDYRISAINAEGVTELYNVKEFYRLRYTDTRVFLLDFTRDTSEIFNTDKTVLTSKGINLGITDSDVEYAFDAKKKVVAFVQENELWSYRVNGGKMTRIFGFPQKENMDYRDFYDRSSIRILRVEASGDVWFCVSGYMNRGVHEGENGIAIYYFEDASSSVEEILFVETAEAFDMLKLDVEGLAYITDNQEDCYLLLEGIVYRVGLASKSCERVIDGVNHECYASSGTNRYFAWLKEGERYDSRTLYLMDFETGTVREITCSEGERIRPVDFMGEDLVYGKALASEIDLSHEGSELFPMYQLTILDEDGEEVKNYRPEGYYVTGVEKTESMLKLTRVKKEGGSYVEALEDHIVSTDTEEEVAYGVASRQSKTKLTEILLRVGTTVSDKKPQTVSAKFLTGAEAAGEVAIPANTQKQELYYVYAGGSLESLWTTAGEAIRRADEQVGVVINNEKEFVWERGTRADTAQVKLETIPAAVRSGILDAKALTSALGKQAIDLTGCTLEQVLYYVSRKRPVLASAGEGVVIITGYDDYGNLVLLRPGETETYFYGPEDSKALFEAAGNQFVTYLETDAE